MSAIPINARVRSTQRVIDALIKHRHKVESLVIHIQWAGEGDEPAESQVSWSEQSLRQLGYALSRLNADLLPALHSEIEEDFP